MPATATRLAFAGTQTLVNGVVFGIHGEQFPAGFCGGGHDQFAGSYENFFIGERNGAAKFDRFIGSFEADYADRGREDHVCAGVRGYRSHAFAAVMNFRDRMEILIAQAAG